MGWHYFSGKKMNISGRRGGDLHVCEIPSMVGVCVFSGTTQF